jgi:hypothetical protein
MRGGQQENHNDVQKNIQVKLLQKSGFFGVMDFFF